jgi:hypothetical protein
MGMNISHWMAMISPMFSLWFPEPVRSYKKSLSISTTWLWRTRNFTMKKMRFNRKTRDPTILWIYTALKKNKNYHQAGIGTSTWSEPDEADQKISRANRPRVSVVVMGLIMVSSTRKWGRHGSDGFFRGTAMTTRTNTGTKHAQKRWYLVMLGVLVFTIGISRIHVES